MTAEPRLPLEVWGGVECTVNRVGDRWFDQLAWSGHDRRLEDLRRFAALGLQAVRYPVLWERHAPHAAAAPDWRWSDQRLACLREVGLRAIVGLVHHGSGPASTSLLDPGFAEGLRRFAAALIRRYPWLDAITPVNEPLTTARFSALYGLWYPHARSDRDFVRALLHQLRGVVLAMDAIRQISPGARLIQTEDCGRTFGTAATRAQVQFEAHRRWLTWDLLAGRVDDRHPLHRYLTDSGMTAKEEAFFLESRCPPDIVGLNYYVTSDRFLDERLDRHPRHTHGGNGRIEYADVDAVRGRGAGIAGHAAHLLAAWRRYRVPVALTEVHLACTREEQLRWLIEAWRGAQRARAAGADVRAITAWALLGSHNWHTLVTRDDRHYEPGVFDTRSTPPRATALASAVAALASGRQPDHPVLDGTPWWRRADRMGGGGAKPADAPPATAAAPILILGASGTLGRAFHRLCQSRGLRSVLAGRADADITNPVAVGRLLARERPWAVVNAAGYVRVDDAESNADACYRANVAGPLNLASSCRRAGIRFVTFSSDLVFDGCVNRPYLEHDAPNPLNVYGASKAEAERRVLGLMTDALVIRTSAFFGPWDRHNFAARLLDALAVGNPFAAPADTTVAPTYVPDLVHATLDLLIDGERGIWHLANAGAATWFEFGAEVARRSGCDAAGVVAVETARLWGPARRPATSVLASARGSLLRSLDEAIGAFTRERERVEVATGSGAQPSVA
jgi:dTDP-4-dehydrorhamnose reductase